MTKGYSGNYPSDFETLSKEEQDALCYWIRGAIAHASRFETSNSSYGLKHDFEKEGFYVTNGQFKGAMLREGFVPKDPKDLNWVFEIKKAIRRTSSLDYDAYDRTGRYSIGWFDKEYARLLRLAGHL